MRIKFRIDVEEGMHIPSGYGLAWDEPWHCRAVYILFPFNHVVAFLRRFWYKFLRDAVKYEGKIYFKGYSAGNTSGYRRGIRDASYDIARRFKDASEDKAGIDVEVYLQKNWGFLYKEKAK